MRLVLVRHGETLWNAERRFQGHDGTGLSPRGHAQAKATAQFLARRYPEASLLVRSDLQRVAETAVPAEAELRVPVRVDPRLREIDVGAWSGMTVDEVAEADPEGYEAWLRWDDTVRRGGGERYLDLRERVCEALIGLLADHTGQTVLVFTHGGPIKVFAAAAMGVPPQRQTRLAGVANCSVSIVEWRGPDPWLVAYNHDGHLPSS